MSVNPLDGQLLCRRDASGQITAISQAVLDPSEVQAGGWVLVPSADPDVQAFVRTLPDPSVNPLSQTDAGLARVLEDLIEVLIRREVIQFTDLPSPAQAKLLERRLTRSGLSNRLDLLPDDSDNLRL